MAGATLGGEIQVTLMGCFHYHPALGGSPNHHPFLNGIFPYHPSILGTCTFLKPPFESEWVSFWGLLHDPRCDVATRLHLVEVVIALFPNFTEKKNITPLMPTQSNLVWGPKLLHS